MREQGTALGLVGCGSSRANVLVEGPPLRLQSYLVAAVSISFEHLLQVNGTWGTMGTGSVGLNPQGQPMAFSHSDS